MDPGIWVFSPMLSYAIPDFPKNNSPVTSFLPFVPLCLDGVQEAELRARPDIVICTPGRMVDHLTNSASVHMDDVEILVLDEVGRSRFFLCRSLYSRWT